MADPFTTFMGWGMALVFVVATGLWVAVSIMRLDLDGVFDLGPDL